jgi:hypothetical protein
MPVTAVRVPPAVCQLAEFRQFCTIYVHENSKKKALRGRAFYYPAGGLLIGTCTHYFHFYTTVFSATVFGLVVSHRLFLALAFSVNTVGLNAFAHQIGFDGFGSANRELLIVAVTTNVVGMTYGNHDLNIHAFDIGDQLVKLGATFRFQDCLVEIKESVS